MSPRAGYPPWTPRERRLRQAHRIVIHFLDHSLLKGHARFFFHHQMQLLVETLEGEERLIPLTTVKAVFFVRSFTGDRKRREQKRFTTASPRFGDAVRVTFLDGELLVGRSIGYRPENRGFYVKPADPDSNNEMVYVPQTSVREVSVGESKP
jgi:hypothetical protein